MFLSQGLISKPLCAQTISFRFYTQAPVSPLEWQASCSSPSSRNRRRVEMGRLFSLERQLAAGLPALGWPLLLWPCSLRLAARSGPGPFLQREEGLGPLSRYELRSLVLSPPRGVHHLELLWPAPRVGWEEGRDLWPWEFLTYNLVIHFTCNQEAIRDTDFLFVYRSGFSHSVVSAGLPGHVWEVSQGRMGACIVRDVLGAFWKLKGYESEYYCF